MNNNETLAAIEARLWQAPHDEKLLEHYQQRFRELEQLNDEPRHNFIIVIPVADRPQHLEACLGSTLKLCEVFGYGGQENGRYARVAVLIADDSKESHNIASHREIASKYDRLGLTCHYFGQSEQLAQLDKLDATTRRELTPILGNNPSDKFFHKGASMMRNIAYLKLNEMVAGSNNTLFYFIDSDQEFQVKVQTRDGERNLYAINYLYHLNKIFNDTDATILTGKVVGDPPVSPSVMAANFLDDVSAFLGEMAGHAAADGCRFHNSAAQNSDDAAYHDMADLFGFKRKEQAFHYSCDLRGAHDHAACFADFARKLNRFFDGEHPTRKSYYEPQEVADSITPARTIYTGNYCFRAEALRYFIPFATLKLRMAGPVLGRIIKAEIGDSFISANLPMLHKRTVDEIGQSEFRPGINREQQQVDLSGEFERQFFGDVMLFSMAQLTEQGYPAATLSDENITSTVQAIEAQMLRNYTLKHQQIGEKIATTRSLFEDPAQWWQQSSTLAESCDRFSHFIANMAANFGDGAEGYRQVQSAEHRALRRQQIVTGITSYLHHRKSWEAALAADAT